MAQKRVLMKGNEVIAEAAIRAGCRNYFGYPITPQTEVMHYMAKKMVQVGGNFVQAESELAAINMVYGAAAAGFRVMTSSSSPGISLKQEGISYIAGAELPAVVVNIVRAGPGLGGIQPAQGDYFQATKGGGHGNYRNIVIAPASVQELYELVVEAFNLADKYRMTCMIVGDGTLGQMMEPVAFRDEEPIETIEKPWAACGRKGESFHHTVTSIISIRMSSKRRTLSFRTSTGSLKLTKCVMSLSAWTMIRRSLSRHSQHAPESPETLSVRLVISESRSA